MKADSKAGRVAYAILMTLAALFLLIPVVSQSGHGKTDVFSSHAPHVEVTILPGMAQNWLLNSGDAVLLDELPGIGPVLAQRIVEDRERDGFFFFPEDVMEVKGVGEARLKGILQWLQEHPEKEYTMSVE